MKTLHEVLHGFIVMYSLLHCGLQVGSLQVIGVTRLAYQTRKNAVLWIVDLVMMFGVVMGGQGGDATRVCGIVHMWL